MTPEEETAVEFAIRQRERYELTMLLLASGARDLKAVNQAIEAYAVACARAALAISRQVQAEKE